jgi:hypothetical protein
MFKKLLAVTAAAACAAFIVALIPAPRPASAERAPQAAAQVAAVDTTPAPVSAPAPVLAEPAAACAQGWPHYEQNCLRDSRRPNGQARVARVVAMDRPAADRAPRTRH